MILISIFLLSAVIGESFSTQDNRDTDTDNTIDISRGFPGITFYATLSYHLLTHVLFEKGCKHLFFLYLHI